MKIGHLFAALAALTVLASCATPQTQKQTQTDLKHLRIAAEGNFPPFSFIANDGSLQGFDVDIAKALCVQMKRDCDFVQLGWTNMFEDLRQRKFDVIVSSMDITEARSKVVAFSDPYYEMPTVIVAPKNAEIALGPDGNPISQSFDGLRIGVVTTLEAETYARKHFKGATIVAYDSIDAAAAGLFDRQIDARFDNILILDQSVLRRAGGEQFAIFGKGYVGQELGKGEGIAVRKEDEALREAINTALKDIYSDGTFQKINSRYFRYDLHPRPAS